MPQVREHTAVRRQQIVDAARKTIIERGSENITIKALADAVGISEGAIYRHFNQKQDVLLLLIDDVGDNLLNDLKYVGRAGPSSLKRVELVLRRHISSNESAAWRVLPGHCRNHQHGRRAAQRAGGRRSLRCTSAGFELLLREGIASGELRPGLDSRAAAVNDISPPFHGLVSLWTLHSYSFDLENALTPSGPWCARLW
jgi:AcrR family transcriptional regulator